MAQEAAAAERDAREAAEAEVQSLKTEVANVTAEKDALAAMPKSGANTHGAGVGLAQGAPLPSVPMGVCKDALAHGPGAGGEVKVVEKVVEIEKIIEVKIEKKVALSLFFRSGGSLVGHALALSHAGA